MSVSKSSSYVTGRVATRLRNGRNGVATGGGVVVGVGGETSGVSNHQELSGISCAEDADLNEGRRDIHLSGTMAKLLATIDQARLDSWDAKIGPYDTAYDADRLGGRISTDYYHRDNCNSFLYKWIADLFLSNDVIARNIFGKEGVAGSTKYGDLFIQYMSGFNTLINVDGRGMCGVGTNNPTDKMHVIGNTRTSGDFIGRGALLSGDVNCNNVNAAGDVKGKDGQFENLKVLGNLDVYELTANQTRVTNGDLWIQDSCKITSVSVASDGSIIIDIDQPSLRANDLCIVQVLRQSGSVVRYSFKVISEELGSTKLICHTITGAHTLLLQGDLIVRVGNTTNTARQSSVLNCVSFGGYGAATLYYANVDSIPVGSFYPDNSKITSAIGDLRAIGYGAAATYTTDGKFKGDIEAQSGRFGNFAIKEDNISAEYITMSDGLLPTLSSLDVGEVVVSTHVSNQVGQDTHIECTAERTIDVSVDSTLLCGYLIDEPVSGWTSFSVVNNRPYKYDYSKVLIYKIEGNSQMLVYSQDMQVSGNVSEGAQVKVNLTAGRYKMMTTARVSVDEGGGYLECNLNGYQLRPIQSMNYLARNGMMSYFGKRNYLRFTSDEDFTIRKGQYMLRVSETAGIQKSINGGGSWQNI